MSQYPDAQQRAAQDAYSRFVRDFADRHRVDLEIQYDWPAEVEIAFVHESRLFREGRTKLDEIPGDPNCPACLIPMTPRGDQPRWECAECGVVRVF